MAAEGGLLSGLWYIFRGKTPAEEGDGQPGDFEDEGGEGGGKPNGDEEAEGGSGTGITNPYIDNHHGYTQEYLKANNLHINPDGSTGHGRDNRHFSDVNPDLRGGGGGDEPPEPGGQDGWGNRY